MKKVYTEEQLSKWFTSGTAFAEVKLSEEVPETKLNGTPSKETSLVEVFDEDTLENVSPDGGRVQKPEAAKCPSSPPPPPLGRYTYPDLPITKKKEELVSLIESNSVVIIQAATGSGKTTQLPQYILDHYNERSARCNIVVTQPRKIGASSIARWVAAKRKCTLGSVVGYQVCLEKMATEHTRLIYMTTGVLLQKVIAAKCLAEYTHIFLDEIHERTEELDFLLLLLKKLLHSNSRHVKIILMSATINCKDFADYFATPVQGAMKPACVFELEGAPFTVEQFYLGDLLKMFPHLRVSPQTDDVHISEELYNVAITLIQSFDETEGKDTGTAAKDGSRTSSERGSVLVFLPGIFEISYMQEALAKLVHKRLQVYPLHSSVTLEEQSCAFVSAVPGYRKVILSTNIAESSVTVPDVKYVIDFCLTRHLVCDIETHYQSLCLAWASKNNCIQRRGRAGRVSKGYCYRLVTKDFWQREIPDSLIPQILRVPLVNIVLKVKLLNMGDPQSLLSTALSPPHYCDIVKSVLQLKEMGALSLASDAGGGNGDGQLTFLGRVLAQLPVSLYLGKLIVLGHIFGCLDECLIIAASHSLKCFFAIPFQQQLAGHRSKLSYAQGTQSDAVAIVNAFQSWRSAKKTGMLRHPRDENLWGKENFIQIKRIKEVAELYEELKNRVSRFNMEVQEGMQSSSDTSSHRQKFILQVVMAGAYYPNYFLQGDIDDGVASKEMSGYDPRTTVMLRSLPPYSFLYYKQIQSLFRLYGHVKAISFDCSRAYVEFSRTVQDSAVLPEVSLSFLRFNQRRALELSVFPAEQIELCPRSKPITHLRYSRVNVDFERQSVTPVELLSDACSPNKIPLKRFFVVNITEVIEVGHFWGYQADAVSLKKLHHLTAEVNGRRLQPVSKALCPNLLCLAPYSENEQVLYYRAKILHVRGNNVEVFFLDYGNIAVVFCSSLRELPDDLLSHPFQAQEFQVMGMCPSVQSIILGNPWSTQARRRFSALVKGQSLLVSLYSIVFGIMRVELFINAETKTSVLDILSEEGHAVKAEESFDSQNIHETLLSVYESLEKESSHIPNSNKSTWNDSKEVIDSLLAQFSKSSSRPSTKVRLQGPFSPYRVSFYNISHRTSHKRVIVDQFSINSLALNANPHYKHQRMLVAGNVTISDSGSNIVLRDTTIMPHIPGLPAILAMLFTPVMELRTNSERTCYTGVLCGLGVKRDRLEAVLPEHDIEINFDVKLDVDDITEINGLRMAMNNLMSSGSLRLHPNRISVLQSDCQDRLLRLFTRSPPRDAVTPVYFSNSGQWNQVDPSLILRMDDSEPGDGSRGRAAFQLHAVPLLNS